MTQDPRRRELSGSTGAPRSVAFGPVRVWSLGDSSAQLLRIEQAPGSPTMLDPRAALRWSELCSANPRLHDGPIWSVRQFDPSRAIVAVTPDSYSRYAVRPSIGEGVSMLAVRGVMVAHDSEGAAHVLMGLRSPQTRVYGDLWEVIPGGGMPGDESGGPPPGAAALIDHLRQEAREEAGIELSAEECRIEGVCDDHYAGGFDVLIDVRLSRTLEEVVAGMGQRDWEHRQVRWMPVREISAFDASEASKISPPTRAIFRHRGWIAGES